MGTSTFTANFPIEPGPLSVGKQKRVSPAYFTRFIQANPDLRTELTAEGEMIVMPPAALESSSQNESISFQLGLWARKSVAGREGRAFDSSCGYTLPNGAIRSPDVSWVKKDRLAASGKGQVGAFRLLCPDFVVELRSKNDSLRALQAKMTEYIANGTVLAWLIDPIRREVSIYRPGKPAEILVRPSKISGNPELKGFTLDLEEVFNEQI